MYGPEQRLLSFAELVVILIAVLHNSTHYPAPILQLTSSSDATRSKEPSKVAHFDGPPTARKPKISAFAFVGCYRTSSEPQLGAGMRAHDESRPFGRCFLCKSEGLLQVRNPRVLTVREVRGGKLFVAESLVFGNVIVHSMPVRAKQ